MARPEFALYAERPAVTIKELKSRFYRIHKVKSYEKNPGYEDYPAVHRPITLVKNPPGFHTDHTPEVYVAVYYRQYFVLVECGRSVMCGPHKFMLMYQVATGQHVHLGTWISEFAFHNERVVRKKLKKGILFNKYFCSERTAEMVIELGEEYDPDIEI